MLVEYKKLGRGNKTVDHRIGENDPAMSFDEKMAKRFALERQVLIFVSSHRYYKHIKAFLVGNTADKIASIFSLIRMHWSPSARAAGSTMCCNQRGLIYYNWS